MKNPHSSDERLQPAEFAEKGEELSPSEKEVSHTSEDSGGDLLKDSSSEQPKGPETLRETETFQMTKTEASDGTDLSGGSVQREVGVSSDGGKGSEGSEETVGFGGELSDNWVEDLPPMDWMERLDEEHPRYKIRDYLHRLFRFLGDPLPEEWPAVSARTYAYFREVLIENFEVLYRRSESNESFTEDQRSMPRYMGETVLYLYQLDWEYPEDFNSADPELVTILEDRPMAITEYDQLYCTPDSTQRRAERVRQEFDRPDSRVIFLGDDDLISVELARNFQGEIHVVDLDERLLRYIREKAPQVQLHRADFILKGLKKEFYRAFDAVLLDPPWDYYRLWCFLEKALFCLKDNLRARVFLSYCPLVLDHRQGKYGKFLQKLARLGFCFEAIYPAFNIYDLGPRHLPDLQERLDKILPELESPLLEKLRLVPFVHSNLYVIRRLDNFKMNPIRRFFFYWWNLE